MRGCHAVLACGVAVVVSVALSACSGDDEEVEGTPDLADRLAGGLTWFQGYQCDCRVLGGEYDDVGQCAADVFATQPEGDRDCLRGAFDRFPDDVPAFVCRTATLEQLNRCVGPESCTGGAQIVRCFEFFDDTVCPEPSEPAENAVKVCFNLEPAELTRVFRESTAALRRVACSCETPGAGFDAYTLSPVEAPNAPEYRVRSGDMTLADTAEDDGRLEPSEATGVNVIFEWGPADIGLITIPGASPDDGPRVLIEGDVRAEEGRVFIPAASPESPLNRFVVEAVDMGRTSRVEWISSLETPGPTVRITPPDGPIGVLSLPAGPLEIASGRTPTPSPCVDAQPLPRADCVAELAAANVVAAELMECLIEDLDEQSGYWAGQSCCVPEEGSCPSGPLRESCVLTVEQAEIAQSIVECGRPPPEPDEPPPPPDPNRCDPAPDAIVSGPADGFAKIARSANDPNRYFFIFDLAHLEELERALDALDSDESLEQARAFASGLARVDQTSADACEQVGMVSLAFASGRTPPDFGEIDAILRQVQQSLLELEGLVEDAKRQAVAYVADGVCRTLASALYGAAQTSGSWGKVVIGGAVLSLVGCALL